MTAFLKPAVRYSWNQLRLNCILVRPAGLEPATSRLGILRSILMSYGRNVICISDHRYIENGKVQAVWRYLFF